MKTPEEINGALECYIKLSSCECDGMCSKCAINNVYEIFSDAIADEMTYRRQLETRIVEANKMLDDLRAKLAEYEKPLVPLPFEDVIGKSKLIYDNAIWLEQPDEEYGYDDTECIPALVSNFANYGMGIQYLRFLVWPKREIVFHVSEKDCYGKTWRCWSRNPTDEERKAAKWDE